ncbi:E3 ubiquitin-protein ligase HUWE1-like [Nilaparvata lugens]|uniref:E3 ubiquitin-protein ligase HUWE1-like n=1 Tax=Nilaparvata lugens TaxID=108931 RepID=UPI00193D3077|nr:E3 ubiquitin-protein ligase HUWE1-like [Nilaparvata lugens]
MVYDHIIEGDFHPGLCTFHYIRGRQSDVHYKYLIAYNPDNLLHFKFIGRVIAKAIYDNKLLECYFTRSFYKHILDIPIKYTDMESEDYTFYKSLAYLKKNHISSIGYDLTFSAEVRGVEVTEVRELKPDGQRTYPSLKRTSSSTYIWFVR